MTERQEILIQGAQGGKTARLVDEYRQALETTQAGRAGECLWLTPTRRAGRQILAQLMTSPTGGLFAPNILTFETFAEKILASSARSIAPLSEVGKRTLLRRIVDDLAASDALPYFSPIARTSGFLDLVGSLITELKRSETWPETFLAACAARGLQPRDRELSAIYHRYQETLLEHGLYDAEGRFWSAREELAAGNFGPFAELSFLAVDGFSDFTRTQAEILEQLAGRSQRVLIGLTLEFPPRRLDLFAKTRVALDEVGERLRKHGPVEVVQLPRSSEADRLTSPETGRSTVAKSSDQSVAAEAAPPLAEFVQLADHLFDNPRETPRLPQGGAIEILAAVGQKSELEAIARQIKGWLLSGVPAGDIVVAVRDLSGLADQFDNILSAAGIPFFCERSDPLSHAASLKALSTLLRLELEDWRFDRLHALLTSSYFRPTWLKGSRREQINATTVALRGLGLPGSRFEILSSLERLGISESASEETRIARQLLSKLDRDLEPLRRAQSFESWSRMVAHLGSQLGFRPRARPQSRGEKISEDPTIARLEAAFEQRDRNDWEVFDRVLFDAVRTEKMLGTATEPMGLEEFVRRLDDLLATQSVARRGPEAGRVRVLDAAQIRNLDIPYLILANLTESSFPRARGEDCLYGESERRQLNEQGLSLGHHSSQGQDEMLLFYGIVTRARRRLVLSYPSVNSKGQPLFPSPYVHAIRELFEPGGLVPRPAGRLDPVPQRDEMLSPRDLRMVAAVEARQGKPGLLGTVCRWEPTRSAGMNLLAAAETASARFQTRGFTRHEGVLRHPAHFERLQSRFSPDHQFSASQLESYARCGFRFLMSEVLRFRPLVSPELATDHRELGSVAHAALANIHRPMPVEEQRPPEELDVSNPESEPTGEELLRLFLAAIDEELKQGGGKSRLEQALQVLTRRTLAEVGEMYVEQFGKYQQLFSEVWQRPPIPHGLEVAFGDAPGLELSGGETSGTADAGNANPGGEGRAAGSIDRQIESVVQRMNSEKDQVPLVSIPPLQFGSGGDLTLVQGRIDRVDVGVHDGRPVFNVIDYKSGKSGAVKLDEIEAGTALQLAIYLAAVSRSGLAGAESLPFQIGYWLLKSKGFSFGLKTGDRAPRLTAKNLVPLSEELLRALDQQLGTIIPALAHGIRHGDFPVDSLDSKCTQYCPYSTICRVGQRKTVEVSLDKRRSSRSGSR